jgi:DNA-binding transcriptional LysR family regulator
MNIRQLETFYWIAQLGTFSAAADRLNTSQANVSARIRELEGELGVALFDRIGRGVQLTVKARELLIHAHKVVTEAANLRMVAGRPEMVHGVIKIGLGEAIAAQSLVAILDELKQRYPATDVEFDVDLNTHLVRKLARGAIDVGVVAGPVDAPELQFAPIGAMGVSWVGAPALFRGRASVSPPDLTALPIMSLPREARLHSLMQEWFAESEIAPQHVSYCNNIATMLDVARAGVCACLVPADLAANDIEAGTLRAPTPIPSLGSLKFYVSTRLECIDPAIPEIAAIVAKATQLSRTSQQSAAEAEKVKPLHAALRKEAALRPTKR